MTPSASLLRLVDLSREELLSLLERVAELELGAPSRLDAAEGPGRVALVFDSADTAETAAWSEAVTALGGYPLTIRPETLSATGPAADDLARLLSTGFRLVVTGSAAVDAALLSARLDIPVLNAGDSVRRPVGVLSRLLEARDRGLAPEELTVAWIGPATPLLHSWLEAAAVLGFALRLAVPDGSEPDAALFLECEGRSVGRITLVKDPHRAAAGADLVVPAPFPTAPPGPPSAPPIPSAGSNLPGGRDPFLRRALLEAAALRARPRRINFRALASLANPG